MKNKKNKFSSLKSTMILLQQLQTQYYGKINIDICCGLTYYITVWVRKEGQKVAPFIFSSSKYFGHIDADERESRYKKLLNYINSQL